VIPARKSPAFARWFTKQSVKRIRKMFSRVYVRGADRLREAAAAGPVSAVSNHTSWWDPLFAIYVANELCRLDSYAMMDAKNLKRMPFLGRVGGFGFYPDDPADRRRVLRYAAELLDNPGRLVWIFPEGGERPRSVGVDAFKPGAAIVAERAKVDAVVPIGLRYEFSGREHPEAYVSIGEPLRPTNDIDAACLAQADAVRAELRAVDAFVRRHDDEAGFVLTLESGPSGISAFSERLLSFFTRYPQGEMQ
jgi:1-acyl-sn-glycerol-3-phosphate acyltransferase